MEYKVVPFKPNLGQDAMMHRAADELQEIIAQQTSGDWKFIQIQEVSAVVQGSGGCFGIGAKDAYTAGMTVVVFGRETEM